MPVSGSACVFVLRAFDEGDFFRREVVEFIDELIDPCIQPRRAGYLRMGIPIQNCSGSRSNKSRHSRLSQLAVQWRIKL